MLRKPETRSTFGTKSRGGALTCSMFSGCVTGRVSELCTLSVTNLPNVQHSSLGRAKYPRSASHVVLRPHTRSVPVPTPKPCTFSSSLLSSLELIDTKSVSLEYEHRNRLTFLRCTCSYTLHPVHPAPCTAIERTPLSGDRNQTEIGSLS